MLDKTYSNFVKSSNFSVQNQTVPESSQKHTLSGEEAKRIYLEEVQNVNCKELETYQNQLRPPLHKTNPSTKYAQNKQLLSNKQLFLAAQNNDVEILKKVLDVDRDRVNTVDEYGWSLLMIACQANSIEAVEELLSYGVDVSITDKAGNSAQSLVFNNKKIADLLLSPNFMENNCVISSHKVKLKEKYECDSCNEIFPDKTEHLASTVHNINASKGRKLPTNFVIPESNKGFQIMLKVGWDKTSGLGPDGEGNKYPIKTVQKKDRRGLGHQKKIEPADTLLSKCYKSRMLHRQHKNKSLEIRFRREFY